MPEIEKKPEIRFKGFNEDWKESKLKTITLEHNAGVYIDKSNYGTGRNIIGVGDIYDGDIIDGTKYSLAPVDDEKYILQENDLIYGESSLVPEGIARTMCVDKNGAQTAFAWHTRRFKIDNNICNSHFLTLQLNYNKKVRQHLKNVSTQTALTGITTEEFFGTNFLYPSIKEQQEISKLFKEIDKLITFYQTRFDKLNNLKITILKKMFPANGEKVPEIRFIGFADEWNQCILGEEVTEIVAGGDVNNDLLLDEGKYPVLANALTNEGVVGYYKENYRINAPAVTVTARGDVGHAKARKVNFTPVVRLLSIKTNHDVDFFENAINNLRIVDESTGVPQLTVPQIEKYQMCIPKSIDEEHAIGTFFLKFDNLINLYQHKIEKLKNIKDACLNKMFI